MYSLLLRNISCQACRSSIKQSLILSGHYKNHVLKNPSSMLQKYNQNKFSTSKNLQQKHYDINTNVLKDVILFKYENPKFFKILNMFAVCQFLFWGYLGHFAYTCLRDTPLSEQAGEVPWWRNVNLGENKYKNTLTISCLIIGYGILGASWMYTLRSVRYLVLRKGGKSISIVTYAPFGENRTLTVNLKLVSCNVPRQNAPVQLPIKVKNKFLYYLLDMKGEFKNVKLFDYTAGLKRTL